MIACFQDYFLEKVLESHCPTCMAHETRRPSFPLFKHTKVGLHEPRRLAQPNPAQGRFQSLQELSATTDMPSVVNNQKSLENVSIGRSSSPLVSHVAPINCSRSIPLAQHLSTRARARDFCKAINQARERLSTSDPSS